MQESEICCVCIGTKLELISIMEADPNTIKYSCKLRQCVPEVVWNEENRICEQCIEQLEAACGFRDLCLQSYAIRRQLLEKTVQVAEVKAEEITIDEDIPMRLKAELVCELSTEDKLPSDEPEFLNVESCYSLLDQVSINETNKEQTEGTNKSYLRDLLQTPQEFLKVKNYTVDKTYSQYMKEKVSEIAKRSAPGAPLEPQHDADDSSDDILYVDTKQNETVLDTSRLREFLQTSQSESNHSVSQAEETNEEQAAESKAYNLDEDGIELVSESIKDGSSNKSLLRDLLLKPQLQKQRNYAPEAENIQCVELQLNDGIEPKPVRLPDQLHAGQKSSKLGSAKNEESYFDNRIKRLPDTPRTEHYQCKRCAVKFKERRNLTKHNKDIHQFDRPWDCIYCAKSFKTLPELKQHEKSHLNHRKYECSVCCRSYNTTSVLAKHKIIKHKSPNEWRYLCPHCDQKYPFKAYRDQHIRRNHTNAGSEYICFHCNTGFSSKLLLIAHIRYKHNSENVMRQCQICQNTYINQADLEGHMLQKHNLETIKFPKKIKKYKCDKCSKLYTTLKAKNSHYDKCDGIRRHTLKKFAEVKLEWTPS